MPAWIWILLALTCLVPLITYAQATRASPFDLALLTTYAWVIMISSLGGVAAFAKKVREGAARPFNVPEFVGELMISVFSGLVTFWFCRWAALDEWLAAAFVAVSGHMGSRAIFLGEQAFERWFGKLTGSDGSPGHQ